MQNHEPKRELGDIIRQLRMLRLQRGLSRRQFAKAMGMSTRPYANWEAGFSAPTAGNLRRLAEYLTKQQA